MVTTIQINKETLLLLRKLKADYQANSYDEAIKRIVLKSIKPEKSMAGSLAKYVGKLSKKEILKDLRDKSDRI